MSEQGMTVWAGKLSARKRRPLAALAVLICLCAPQAALPGPETFFSPKGGVRQRLLAAIRSASESIDVAVYHITSFELADALAVAKARGVRIRILTDGEKLRVGGGAYRILARHRVPVRALSSAEESLMHHKFAVFDERIVATGSYNWTQAAERTNYENLVLFDDRDVVARFTREFQRLWWEAKE